MTGSLTKEFPIHDVDNTIRLVRGGMSYDSLRSQASQNTHVDIPALLSKRFLLVREGVIIRDRFLSFVDSEGVDQPRIRKIMYLVWALRDHRLRRFILERICDSAGRWRPREITHKGNAIFFEEFFQDKTTPKVRSNIERFFVEAGIFDTNTQQVELSLADGWLPDAIQVAAQHEDNPARRRAMVNDPIGFLISQGWGGLANATVDGLRGVQNDVDLNTDAIEDDEIEIDLPPLKTSKKWNRNKPKPRSRQDSVSQTNLVAQERASQAHHLLEKIMAAAATAAGFEPKFNDNIDMFFSTTKGTILAEMKSCWELNLHTQFRRGVSQLFEYEYVYSEMLRPKVIRVMILEIKPTRRNAWLLDYAKHLGILIAWKNESADLLESSMDIPQSLSNIITKC